MIHYNNNYYCVLTITGPLSSVGGLSYSFINSSTVNITWSPPFTLPGTNIIGYNISVATSNDSTNVTTSDNYYVLSLTDSSCDKIIVTVSGYNGLDGENSTIMSELIVLSYSSSVINSPPLLYSFFI